MVQRIRGHFKGGGNMNTHNSAKTQCDYIVLCERRRMLRQALDEGQSDYMVIMMAEGYLRSFALSWPGIWMRFKLERFPLWLLWLTDSEYRWACRVWNAKQQEEQFQGEFNSEIL